MAVDHTRALPVAPERLEHLAQIFYDMPLRELNGAQLLETVKVALQAEQVEHTQNVAFFLSEAYDIYNARFR